MDKIFKDTKRKKPGLRTRRWFITSSFISFLLLSSIFGLGAKAATSTSTSTGDKAVVSNPRVTKSSTTAPTTHAIRVHTKSSGS